jgi:hypothetical protein
MRCQGQGGLTGPASAVQGGSITVQVESGDGSIVVTTGGVGDQVVLPVPPDGKVTFPVPNVTPGTLVRVTTGKGNRMTIIQVEVVSTGP